MKSGPQLECADTAVRTLADLDLLHFRNENAGREESDCATGLEPSFLSQRVSHFFVGCDCVLELF